MQKKYMDLVKLITGKMGQEKDLVLIRRTWLVLKAGIERKAADAEKVRKMV